MFEETGLIGELGNNNVEKIMFSPVNYDDRNYMKPKYLKDYDSSITNNNLALYSDLEENVKKDINNIIEKIHLGIYHLI